MELLFQWPSSTLPNTLATIIANEIGLQLENTDESPIILFVKYFTIMYFYNINLLLVKIKSWLAYMIIKKKKN